MRKWIRGWNPREKDGTGAWMESSWKGRDRGGWNPRGKNGTGEDGILVERTGQGEDGILVEGGARY